MNLYVQRDSQGWRFFQTPTKNDTMMVASKQPIPWYHALEIPYLTIVRDLMLAGF